MTTHDSSINFVVAHFLEAAPVIENFRLKPVQDNGPFARYKGPNINLIVTGIGRLNAAAATAYLGAVTKQESVNDAIWINAGISGHRSLALGEVAVAHKIVDVQTGAAYFPLPIATSLHSTALFSVDAPERKYSQDSAYDMEGAAFWATARKFSPMEYIQLIKVVSDNADNAIENINKQKITEYMLKLVSKLDGLVEQLQQLALRHNAAQSLPAAFQDLSGSHKFTVTQLRQLRRACQRFKAAGIETELEVFLRDLPVSAKDLLSRMSSRLDALEL